MENCVINYLQKRGYEVNSNALSVIEECDNWYSNRVIDNFHKRKNLNGVELELKRLNFAKRCCADDANLCEIISVVPEKESGSEGFIETLFRINRFDTEYRRQLEYTAAMGTVGAYIYLHNADYFQEKDGTVRVHGGDVRINYVNADGIIPLTVENDLVTECAFCCTNLHAGKKFTTLVVFSRVNGMYVAETVKFDENGTEQEDEHAILQLGDVKPFAIMHTAEVNNLDDMLGYGLPKVYGSIPTFMITDLCYNLLYGDLSKADKLVFINELLACVKRDRNGKPYLSQQQKEIFILLGEDGSGKLPEQESLVQEYNPEIRIEEITKAFELALSLLSMSFGYGTKKYTFENGRITTATEYIGTKQDSMQELNKQRKQAEQYIEDIVHAAMWFSNQFSGTGYNIEEPLVIEFDDSYVTDRESELERKRNDALSFDIPQLTVWYLMEAYNLSEEEAVKLVNAKADDKDPDDDQED